VSELGRFQIGTRPLSRVYPEGIKACSPRVASPRATLGKCPVNDSSLKGLHHHVSRLNPTRRLRRELFRTALKSGEVHLEKKHDDDAPPGAQCKFEPNGGCDATLCRVGELMMDHPG